MNTCSQVLLYPHKPQYVGFAEVDASTGWVEQRAAKRNRWTAGGSEGRTLRTFVSAAVEALKP
jgi:hypothetical protein